MIPETSLEQTEHGQRPAGEGWFVLNARDARWLVNELGAYCGFEGEHRFEQLGINLNVLEPGVPMCMYHWENDQEDFLVLAGEALLIVEGQERPLKQWDFVHCPRRARHVIVGAGSGTCLVLAVGSREADEQDWGGYPVDEVALGHEAGVERETSDAKEAYAGYSRPAPTEYRDGWLPDY